MAETPLSTPPTQRLVGRRAHQRNAAFRPSEHRGLAAWPPVSPDFTSLRVTESTLWEAAWAEVDLPR